MLCPPGTGVIHLPMRHPLPKSDSPTRCAGSAEREPTARYASAIHELAERVLHACVASERLRSVSLSNRLSEKLVVGKPETKSGRAAGPAVAALPTLAIQYPPRYPIRGNGRSW
jgi:hypothetical protein